ncbi:MAG: fibronectin type III domain-containing protein [Tenericutes bacterium]|nr:fibronectin type III domain-containing protein [Mycoplasmatota bacterium]
MRRKFGKKNTILFVLFSLLIIGIIIIFFFGVKMFMQIGNKEYSVQSGSIIYDKDNKLIKLSNNGKIYKGYSSSYMLKTKKDKENIKYNLGKDAVVFNSTDYKMYLYGSFYQVLLSGNVVKMNGRLEIIRDNGPFVYKLDDRKYLVVSKKLESEDNSIKTSNYLLIDIDKNGSVTLYNNELQERIIKPIILNCDNFKFDIANEKLVISSKIVNLKEVNGSTNYFVAKKDDDGNIIEPTKKDLEKDETPETDNTNDYYASYFNKITKSFNNLTNSVIQGSAKNDSDNTNKNLDLTRWLSLSDVSVSVNSITVNYNVFDPNNEYNSVFIDFESSNLNGMKRIQLSKESNSYIINELIPDTEYKITIGYTLQENPKQEVYDDIVKVKTNKPDYRINVTKVTQNKVYFNVKIDSSYVIENGNIAMYVDDELYNVSKIDIKKASTKAGWDSSFDFERKQSMVELKLENLKYNGNDIDINVSYKYKN